MSRWHVLVGDCVPLMAGMDASSIDAIVTDPPYGLEFMGKEWDRLARPKPGNIGGFSDGNKPSFERVRSHLPAMQSWHFRWAIEALRVLKPGGHLLAFGGTRTYHRLVCGLEDAGFEIRDTLCWLYGSGFPKSLDVSKAIDKAAGVEREIVAQGKSVKRMIPGADQNATGSWIKDNGREFVPMETSPATDAARQWDGWGTALKPAHEPTVLARKPLSEPTVAANVLKWGTGAINIDGCRIEGRWVGSPNRQAQDITGGNFAGGNGKGRASFVESEHPSGRWPANLLLDEDAAAMLDEQGGNRRSAGMYEKGRQGIGPKNGPASIPIDGLTSTTYDDSGGASRFFYVAKADRAEREFGVSKNGHPTVKPVNLMRWLCRLITPPDGVILDPFLGSGTTGIAALQEGFRFIGIEQDEGYADTARRRIEADGHRQEVLL